jgi:diadenosine tetraphosphate (Ap4A) HIT family hydrolase
MQAIVFIGYIIDYIKTYHDEKYLSDGYNVGINFGKTAGQTIQYAHIHGIPRYHRDMQSL